MSTLDNAADEEKLIKLCISNLESGIQALDQLASLPVSKLFKKDYADYIKEIRQELERITNPNERGNITKLEVVQYLNYFERTGKN